MGKKGKKNEEDYLASLAGEDEEEQVTTAPQPTNNKKQQKNNKKSVVSDDDDEDNSEEEVMVSMKPKKQQPKKKKGNAPSAKTNAFALLDDDEDNNMPASDSDNDNEDSEDDFVAKPKTKPNKKQKKKQQKSIIDDLDEDDESVAAVDQKSDEEESDDDYVAPPTKSNNKKKKGGAAAAASASTTAKKAPQGKKGKKAKNDDDYLSSLAAADEEENQDAAVTQSASKKGGNKVEDDDDEDDGGIPLDQRDPSTLSAKEKKKLKKMRQKDEKKEEKKPAEKKKDEKKKDEKKKDEKKKDEKKKPAAEEKKGGAPKKVNAGIAALKAAMEKKKQEEERIRQEEERRIREEEAALKLLEDQKRQEELEKKKIKDDKKKKELDLKNKGLWKSKKQLEQEKMARLRAESFIAQGLIPGREPSSKKKPAAQKKPAAETKKPAAPQPAKKVAEPTKPKPVEEEQPTPQEHDEDEYGSAFDNEPEATPVEQAAEEEEDEGVEDWEDLEDVLEDKPSAKEEEKKKQQAAAEAKRKQEELAKKKAQELANRKDDDSQKDEDSQTSDDVNKHKGNADLRSPICCVLGHVDTGKTKLLDKIRNTNVQTGEAGGITQQIGATYVPIDAVKRQTKRLNELTKGKLQYNLPGLLIIDTPGHESFTNLRSRGSSLCDIAILVVDILHGLERQTLESINLLRQRKTPFIVALNKIDTIYGWKATPNSPIKESLKNQPKHTLEQFEENVRKTIALFNGEGFNAELYYKNKDIQNYVSLVPTSAITGEGLPDLLALMCQLCQKHMVKRITLQSKFQCTILEVKVIDGHGTTIDVILSNGMIREGDRIVVCTLNGPVVTCIRALLTPQPLKELRVKGEYMHHKEIRASQGIKISAPDLEGAVAGSQVLLVRDGDDVEELKDEVMSDLNDLLSRIAKTGKGVYVQSSTLGSLEALLEFLHSEKIPVSGINIGPVHKKDIVKTSVMLETHPEYAVLLAFDVPISKEAEDEAQKMGVKIFRADIIYHLFDQFMAHTTKIKEEKKKNTEKEVVWPCVLKISETNIFRQKDPITVGVDIVEGVLRLNTPLVIPTRGFLSIGRVIGIQHQKVSLREAERGKSVAIQIDAGKTIQYGRHFNHSDLLYSRLTRDSIDMLKELFGDELKKDKELLLLIVKLKKILNIQ